MNKTVIIALILLSIIINLPKKKFVNTIPFNQDEIDYVGNSFLWTYYKKLDFRSSIWDQSWAYDQPHLYHFIIGSTLEKQYQQPVTQLMDSLGFSKRLTPGSYYVAWNQEYLGSPQDISDQRYQLILSIRQLSYYFYIGAIILIILSAYILGGKLLSIIALTTVFFDTKFITFLIPATSDSLFFLFFSIAMFLWTLKLSKTSRVTTSFIMIQVFIAALATSTKLNGLILLIFINLYLTIFQKINYFQIIISNLVFYAIFVLLNPFLWINPLYNTLFMFSYRLTVNSQFNLNFPSQAIPSYPGYALGYILSPDHWSIVSLIFSLTFIAISLYSIRKFKISLYQNKIIIFCLVLLLLFLQYTNVNWGRYYILARLAIFYLFFCLYSIWTKLKKTK